MSEEQPRSARGAWIVIGTATLIGTLLAIFVVFPNLKSTAATIHTKLVQLDADGGSMTPEACVADAVAWFQGCDEGMCAMFLQEVPKVVAHCLRGGVPKVDRTEGCAPYINLPPTAQWAYKKCEAAGITAASPKEHRKACTAAWRALDHYCKSGQKGVIWGVK